MLHHKAAIIMRCREKGIEPGTGLKMSSKLSRYWGIIYLIYTLNVIIGKQRRKINQAKEIHKNR